MASDLTATRDWAHAQATIKSRQKKELLKQIRDLKALIRRKTRTLDALDRELNHFQDILNTIDNQGDTHE